MSPSLADLAVASLLAELELFPKPGLVSPVDSGSHRDMDFPLLRKSALTLRGAFHQLAEAGAGNAHFADLAAIGLEAETLMLAATGGVNTHRGAIFSLGLLTAAAARSGDLRSEMLATWGDALQKHAARMTGLDSNGARVRRATGIAGARAEAAAGFPSVFDLARPHLHRRLANGCPARDAAIDTLFVLIAETDDSNILHRGGIEGAAFAKEQACGFLAVGGITHPAWRERAIAIHRAFIDRNLSPGGAADLLAATLFVESLSCGHPKLLMDISPGLHDYFSK